MFEAEPADPRDPRQRIYAALWNESHSIASVLAGIRVAVLMEPFERDPRVRETGGPIALWWVSTTRRGEVRYHHTRITAEDFLAAVRAGLRGHVLLARPDAGPIADEALAGMGYRREILGQVAGYWFGPGREIPGEEPGYNPTGGIVPRVRGDLRLGELVLAIVPIDGEWRPATAEAVHTYSFTAGLAAGETWRFVPAIGLAGVRWPHVLRLELAEPISGGEIRDAYGDSASSRARPRVDYLQMKIAEAPAT